MRVKSKIKCTTPDPVSFPVAACGLWPELCFKLIAGPNRDAPLLLRLLRCVPDSRLGASDRPRLSHLTSVLACMTYLASSPMTHVHIYTAISQEAAQHWLQAQGKRA